jgi:hypothetical protein
MKALLITLLLLFIAISPSFTTPPTAYIAKQYIKRQKIVYTAFTNIGFIMVEILWDPARQRLVTGNARNIAFNHNPEGAPAGTIEVNIPDRSIRRWEFTQTGLRSHYTHISVTFNFYPIFYHGTAFTLPRGGLAPGSRTINSDLYNLRHLTFSVGPNGHKRGQTETPLAITYMFMTVLPLSVESLDTETEQTLRSGGIDVFLPEAPEASFGPCLRPLPQLDPRIWTHLLTNTMDEYQPGDIRCDPAPANPDPKRQPNTSGSCRPDAFPRGPDDQGEDPGNPGDQRGTKRKNPDSNTDQGSSSGKNRDIDLNTIPTDEPYQKVIYDFPLEHEEIQRGFGLWGPFATWNPRTINYGISLGIQMIICHEVLKGSRSIHDELRR